MKQIKQMKPDCTCDSGPELFNKAKPGVAECLGKTMSVRCAECRREYIECTPANTKDGEWVFQMMGTVSP